METNTTNTVSKALDILEQINKLPLDETPVFTWDEMEKAKRERKIEYCISYLAAGFLIGFSLMGLLDAFKHQS